MTITAASIVSTRGLTVDCANIQRLAYGPTKNAFDIAQFINLAAGSPATGAEVASMHYKAPSLIWEIVADFDRAERCRSGEGHTAEIGEPHDDREEDNAHGLARDGGSACVDSPFAQIADPVEQLFVAFASAEKGELIPKRHKANGKLWTSVTDSPTAFDQLLYWLGDHTPPAAPLVSPLAMYTNQLTLTLSGSSEPGATISVVGGRRCRHLCGG